MNVEKLKARIDLLEQQVEVKKNIIDIQNEEIKKYKNFIKKELLSDVFE